MIQYLSGGQRIRREHHGKIEVRGNAARTVDYDRMKVEINFHSVEISPTAASEKSMKECEKFLKVLKGDGFDISKIAIK